MKIAGLTHRQNRDEPSRAISEDVTDPQVPATTSANCRDAIDIGAQPTPSVLE